MVDFKKLRQESIRQARSDVKASFSRDLLIIQAVNSIEELNTVSNMLANRLREWYGFYNPGFVKAVRSNEEFVSKIVSAKKQKDSMGADLEQQDLKIILDFAKQIASLHKIKDELTAYLDGIMKEVCPNLNAVAGSFIGAKLLSFAGSLKNLSEMTSSTVQLLGAEKALFRHLHGQGKSPKHGILVNHELVLNAQFKEKGKVARALADKIAIASKVDYFKGAFVGDKLRADLEKRFK
jgi:nucleolar protein 56